MQTNKPTNLLQNRIQRLERTSYHLSWVRLVVAVAGLTAAGLIYYLQGLWPALAGLGVALLIFSTLVYIHHRLRTGIARHHAWQRIKNTHRARAALDWDRLPTPFGNRPREDHPFEADLDLVGPRSLYRLLDTAVSYEGSQKLKSWLTAPVPDPAATRQRQALVRELVPLQLLRDKLTLHATLAAGTSQAWQVGDIVGWLQEDTPARSQRLWLLLQGGWAALNLVVFLGTRLFGLPPVWRITFVFYLAAVMGRAGATRVAADQALALQDALRQLNSVFRQLETFSYRGVPHLQRLCAPFLDAGQCPSCHLTRLVRLVAAMGLRENPVAWFVLNAVLPWDAYFTYRLDRYKQTLAGLVPDWMEIWFELEALGALANFAHLNPHYAFPALDDPGDTASAAVFEAQGLGHPLIPASEKVRNDFHVPHLGQVALITGSNMAGKTVFLKTVGVNLALTYAGGPVDARALQTRFFRMFSSMRINDSVTGGISYFYAEVKRLKALLAALEAGHPLPLFFFIDEIFRGTNNRERLIGSRAYVDRLAGQHGVGLIATHDLELTRLAEHMPEVQNYHFRDHVIGDRMAFDYILRPGPSPTTNALKIMAQEGLIPDALAQESSPASPHPGANL